ncbi:MAG: HU family DNA-binding protein [Actinomycetota bacterium]|nr:HU family DNA-binding protein [Actinomycetota bacterium]
MTHNGRGISADGVCVGGAEVNKAQLIDALTERLGDKKVAAAAVAGLVDVVIRTVNDGDRVTITGFGVFEKRARAARTARNPRTGEAVTIRQTDVPAFRPGTLFREVISGTRVLPQAGPGAPAVSAAALRPVPSPAPTDLLTASASRRPATRVAEAGRLTAVHPATTKAPKAPKAKAAKVKVAKKAKPAKAAKKKAKTTAEVPAKSAAKKAVKKSATKKLRSM